MTYLRNISRFAVLFIALAVVTAAAIPDGWIALRHVPAQGEESGYWILVKEPADGLAAWWSDEELAKIIAGDENYVQQLETDWSPEDHPVAMAAEATALAEELADYWDGDLPQANFWAHGALTRRGSTPQAFRWEQDGLTQRTQLEAAGFRPQTAVAPLDPDPVDARWDNSLDIVDAGDGWGSHLLTPTLDHVNRAERNKARRRHHPNSPPSGEIERATKATVAGCRAAGLAAEQAVFENYVRAWGGLSPKSMTYNLPENCILAMAPPQQPITPPQQPVTPPQRPVTPPQQPVTPPQQPVTPPQRPVTPPQRPITPPQQPVTPPQQPVTPPQQPVTPPQQPVTPPQKPVTPPSDPNPGCTISWLCGSDPGPDPVDPNPDPVDPDPVTTDPGPVNNNPGNSNSGGDNGGGNRGGGGGGGGTTDPPDNGGGGGGNSPAVKYTDCDGDLHDTQAAADAVDCTPKLAPPPQDDPQYTACDGTLHHSQEDADAIPCFGEETDNELNNEYCRSSFEPGCSGF